MQLKQDSSTNVITAIEGIERRADECWDDLELYSYPKGKASWAILTFLVVTTEQVRKEHGYKNYGANLINLSMRGALALGWIQKKGSDVKSELTTYRWTPSLARAVSQALSVAANYRVFLDCFPMWHQNRELAELISESVVRFTVPGAPPTRRVSAFQKGFKPDANAVQDEGLALDAEQTRKRDVGLSRCFYSGHLAITYSEPMELYRSLLPSHLGRYEAIFRRADSVNLGPYTIGKLKRAYAALATVFAVHEDFCYRMGERHHEYPVNSCVMTRTFDEWTNLIARIAGLDQQICSAVVDDLILHERFRDLHIQPFVSVGDNVLAVAPQFPLSSRADENILRVCNHRRRAYFDASSLLKEQEMLDDFITICPKKYSPCTRISLPNRLPDIDLLLVDEDSQAVIVAEMKWLQKPSAHWKDRIHREEDFGKGLRQLASMRTFLEENPSFLSNRKKVKRPLNEYKHVAFVLIARDFFLWPDSEEIILVDYDAFKEAVGRTADLTVLIDKLKTYDWLPLEGKHFRVAYEPVGLNGVTVESETFYRI